MKNLVITLVLFLSFSLTLFSQQWIDQIYEVDTITDVNYGSAINFNNTSVDLHMDIFLPKCQDTSTIRPLMIVAHGGGLIAGSYKDGSIQDICAQFARRGYVTASVEYRLGYINDDSDHQCNLPNYPCLFATDTLEWYRAYFRAIQDIKGATRYLVNRKDQFHIDEQNVFVVGESAGAIVTMGAAYMDDPSEKPAAAYAVSSVNETYQNAQDNCEHNMNEVFNGPIPRPDLGGIDGTIEPALYPFTIRGVGNMYGGMFYDLLSTSANPVKPAMYGFHQACDIIVPWDSKKVYFGLTWCLTNGYGCFGVINTPIMHGTKTITDWNTNSSLGYNIQSEYVTTPFPYEYIGFSPKNCFDQVVNENGCHAYDNKTLRMTNLATFFATQIVNPETCVPFNSIISIENDGLLVYPNPVADLLQVKSDKLIEKIQILDVSGNLVQEFFVNGTSFQSDLSKLSSGIYVIECTFENQQKKQAMIRK